MAVLRNAFENPDALRSPQTAQQVTEEAARQFARLAQLLRRYGAEPHATAHFLIRLLFCLFAEDVGILPDGIFTRLVTRPHRTTKSLTEQLRQLFVAMAGGGSFGADEILHVDGGLFDDDAALDLDSDGLAILAEVSTLDWSAIQPSIFGTLFERGLDPAKRSQLGAHYTGEEDILLIVEPVLMAPLRRRWGEVKAEARLRLRNATWWGRPCACQTRSGGCKTARRRLPGEANRGRRSRRSCSACCAASARSWQPCRYWTRRAAAEISCTWRCACCSTWRRKPSTWR